MSTFNILYVKYKYEEEGKVPKTHYLGYNWKDKLKPCMQQTTSQIDERCLYYSLEQGKAVACQKNLWQTCVHLEDFARVCPAQKSIQPSLCQ